MADLSPRPLRMTERDRGLFVNREAERRAAIETLRHGGNVLLLGRRGSGKTSLLHVIGDDLAAAGVPAVLFNGGAARSANDVLAGVRRLVTDAWSIQARPEPSEGPDGAQLKLADPEEPEHGPSLLLDELELLRRTLLVRGGGVVLLNDLPGVEAARTLFGRLRDDLLGVDLRWCVAVDDESRGAVTAPPARAFWSSVVELSPLTVEDIVELLARRDRDRELGDDVRVAVAEAADGIPRRALELATAALATGLGEAVSYRAARDSQVGALSGPAQRLLAELEVIGPRSASDENLQASLGWTRGRLAQVFKELEGAGLVQSTTEPGRAGRPRRLYEVKR